MACAICKTRREKRHCPGVQGEICPTCCGTEREETVDCPLDCEYLQIAREHEVAENDPAGVPNQDFAVPENFLEKNLELLTVLDYAILQGSLPRKAIDFDVREALDGLVRTYKALGSGLYYESRPSNPISAAIYDGVQQQIAEIRTAENERGLHKIRDSDFLTALIFLQRLEYAINNGRRKGRAFLAQLLGAVPQPAERPSSSLIIS
jgi:hypothetical protein